MTKKSDCCQFSTFSNLFIFFQKAISFKSSAGISFSQKFDSYVMDVPSWLPGSLVPCHLIFALGHIPWLWGRKFHSHLSSWVWSDRNGCQKWIPLFSPATNKKSSKIMNDESLKRLFESFQLNYTLSPKASFFGLHCPPFLVTQNIKRQGCIHGSFFRRRLGRVNYDQNYCLTFLKYLDLHLSTFK